MALICGDQKVGHRSDQALIEELDLVLGEVGPDCAILVGDGAEDEYTYPIVSSRVPIDSVRKVFVKQAPSLEGAFYVLVKAFNDPQKKERFLAPLAWVVLIVSSVYLITDYIRADYGGDFLLGSTTPLIFFFIGAILLFIAYSVSYRLHESYVRWSDRAKRGSLTVIFLVAAVIFVVIGVVIGAYSVGQVYTTSFAQRLVIFCSNSLWLVLFGAMLYLLGELVDRYANFGLLKYSIVTNLLHIVAVGLLLTAFFDVLSGTLEVYQTSVVFIAAEFAVGVSIAIFATYNQYRVRRAIAARREASSDEVLRMGADLHRDLLRHGLFQARGRGLRAPARIPHARFEPGRRGRHRAPHEGRTTVPSST